MITDFVLLHIWFLHFKTNGEEVEGMATDKIFRIQGESHEFRTRGGRGWCFARPGIYEPELIYALNIFQNDPWNVIYLVSFLLKSQMLKFHFRVQFQFELDITHMSLMLYIDEIYENKLIHSDSDVDLVLS